MEIKGQLLFFVIAVVVLSISSFQTTAVHIGDPKDKVEPEFAGPLIQTENSDFNISSEVCKSNNDCKEVERCLEGRCTNACSDLWCEDHGTCHAENHIPVCRPTNHSESADELHKSEVLEQIVQDQDGPEFAGPLIQTEDSDFNSSSEVCKTNNDCEDDERCLEDRCTNACSDLWCGDHGTCHIEKHAPVCNFIDHSESFHQDLDCITDDDCEDHEKCNHEMCVDICKDHQCALDEECSVIEFHPVCISSNESIATSNEPNCTRSDDCADFEKCDNNTCIDACHPNPCGVGAMCGRYNHTSICVCHHDITVAPQTDCVKMIDCFTDDDCEFNKACRDNDCHNPCESNPCGKNALCAGVYLHHPVCMCDTGLAGDPYIECTSKKQEKETL